MSGFGYNWVHNVAELAVEACKAHNVKEWQNHATSGRKVEAIKAIRYGCGFGLKEAKDVLEYWLENGARLTALKTTVLPNYDGRDTRREVVQHNDGTFTIVTTSYVRCNSLDQLLLQVAHLYTSK